MAFSDVCRVALGLLSADGYEGTDVMPTSMLHPFQDHCRSYCQQAKSKVAFSVQVKLNRGLDFPSLDDILVDMKLAPEVLELPCPAYFREDRAKVLPKFA